MSRNIQYKYLDPLDLIWLKTAERCGLKVLRSSEVFAAWDGQSTLTLSTTAHFDPDDSLAQLILHELCHALIEGPSGQGQIDWGLKNTDEEDLIREHACHRLQSRLTQGFGLRRFFGVTTEWRPYYDSLPPNSLSGEADPATHIAKRAYQAYQAHPWREIISQALQATRLIAQATQGFADSGSLWRSYEEE